MNEVRPVSGYHLQKVIALAQETISRLRSEDGLVIETEAEIATALADEGVQVEDVLRQLVRAALDAKAKGVAADARVADLRARRERFKRQEEAYRATVLAAMDALGMSKFSDPEFTLSISAGKPKLQIIDDAIIPDRYTEMIMTTSPDKAAIKAALERGEEVPGATMSNGAAVLTVRTR